MLYEEQTGLASSANPVAVVIFSGMFCLEVGKIIFRKKGLTCQTFFFFILLSLAKDTFDYVLLSVCTNSTTPTVVYCLKYLRDRWATEPYVDSDCD